MLGFDELKADVESGAIDTVVVAFTDMQGRLQGKRLHGRYFVEHVVGHGTEGCNYLLAVDVDMNTVGGYAISSWACPSCSRNGAERAPSAASWAARPAAPGSTIRR